MLGREMNMENLTLAFVFSVLRLREDSCPTGVLESNPRSGVTNSQVV